LPQPSLTDFLFGTKPKHRKPKKRARKVSPGKATKRRVANKREPWQIPLEEWKHLKGYEHFWMFRDYSPSQWAGMSKRTQRQIEKQHRKDARRNEGILQEHQRAVVKAYFESKPVPKSVLGRYEGVIRRKKAMREARIESETKEMQKYKKALRTKKMEFGRWWQKTRLKETPHLKGFEHVMRQEAYRYWKATRGITKGVPRYVLEHVGIMQRRWDRISK